MTGDPRPTLGALLARRDLALAQVVAGDAERADADLRWVHSSDLLDPTPFLSEGLALLTTGTQFGHDDDEDVYDAYIARLARRGVVGVGFGTEVVREGVPAPLADAARRHGMPLFEVPYRIPFIAVARAHAESLAARAYARRSWSLAAQRAISLAALAPDGLTATVAELARQLESWVGLYNAGGVLAHEGAEDRAARPDIDARVAQHLLRGQGASASFDLGDVHVTLQTLGRGGHLRGVLSVAGRPLDAEARGVVNAVAAMAGLALGQTSAVRRARGALRTAVVQALVEGDRARAARVADPIGGLPAGLSAGLVVGVVDDADAPRDAVDEWLEARSHDLYSARLDGDLVLLAADDGAADELAAAFPVSVGLSAPTDLDGVAEALAQARSARRGRGVARFAAADVLGAATGDEARLRATALLAPLAAHDAERGTDLVGTVRTWLEEDAAGDRTARRLGVHRHTVRARIALAERVLGRDLAGFPARAELWAALRLVGTTSG